MSCHVQRCAPIGWPRALVEFMVMSGGMSPVEANLSRRAVASRGHSGYMPGHLMHSGAVSSMAPTMRSSCGLRSSWLLGPTALRSSTSQSQAPISGSAGLGDHLAQDKQGPPRRS